jgi:arginyl-tRNA synthetase
MNIKHKLKHLITCQLIKTFEMATDSLYVNIRKSSIKGYDYQTDVAFSLAKSLGKTPSTLFSEVNWQELLDYSTFELTGNGFINIKLTTQFIEQQLTNIDIEPNQTNKASQRIVIDYCSANVAKEMHVGHLRSTVIGDALARIFEFSGYKVIRQNHLGDWGTQFGFIIEYIIQNNINLDTLDSSKLNFIYQESRQQFDNDSEFEAKSRERLHLLQNGDNNTNTIWQKLVHITLIYMNNILTTLNVLLEDQDIRGESYYNSMLQNMVSEAEAKGIATESQGAKVIFLEGFINKDKTPNPLIIQKSDKTFLYATTDLAAIKYRCQNLNADKIIYVTDARQKQHFAMVFAAAKNLGFIQSLDQLVHVPFGAVLNDEKRPLKTRSGDSPALKELLHEAENKALAIISAKGNVPAEQIEITAQDIGIGALKYFDLRNDLIKDYVFNWEQMLSFEGNTATYLQNAYVRARSIMRKAEFQGPDGNIAITNIYERKLCLLLLEFNDAIDMVCNNYKPHYLCAYLYELASSLHEFYENCRVYDIANPSVTNNRLLILYYVTLTLAKGLDLLGINIVEQM